MPRITEHWRQPLPGPQLRAWQREEIEQAIEAWRQDNGRKSIPLQFTDGRVRTRQWVGVVEAGGVSIEICPKLDAALLVGDMDGGQVERSAPTVMRNLLWMIDVAHCGARVSQAGSAGLAEEPEVTFFDVFAHLLSHHLLTELEAGVAHAYVEMSDDLPSVRGRIDFVAQSTQNWNRYDRIACTWEEFTPNTPMNRLLKCACRKLQTRVGHPDIAGRLADCVALLDEVDEVSVPEALHGARSLRPNRLTDRFWKSFKLASRLLDGTGHALEAGNAESFTFLIDMNRLFQDYVHKLLQARFSVPVKQQRIVGRLFKTPASTIQQPDYYWEAAGNVWIGDAKYKNLIGPHFPSMANIDLPRAVWKAVDAADIRQLVTYAELERRRRNLPAERAEEFRLALLYPSLGNRGLSALGRTCWNGSRLTLAPVIVNPGPDVPLSELLPGFAAPNQQA